MILRADHGRTTAGSSSRPRPWLKHDSLLDTDNLPDPDVIAEEIAEDLRSALDQIEEILGDLQQPSA